MSQEEINSAGLNSKSKMLVIGNYVLGTFGKVRQATHIPSGEKVAIKILEKDKVLDLSDSERINRELHIMRLMQHPYIVDLYEPWLMSQIIETPKHLFIIMDFAMNGELYDYITNQNRVSEEEGSKIFIQIILGIEYIHKLGIVHRDLKPENLLLDYQNRVKIVDFGLSNIYRKGEQLKTACGSPCYAAPEMISGKLYDGINVDTWSCGVILYTLLCGRLPFEAKSAVQVYDKILSGQFQKPDHLSSEARDLLERILDLDPEKRIKIHEIKTHPFFKKYGNDNIKPNYGIIIGKDKIPVDMSIVKQMNETLGFPENEIVKSIEANSHNVHTTTYKLLLKKRLLNSNGSKYDINSANFDPSLLLKPQKVESTKQIDAMKQINVAGKSSLLQLMGDRAQINGQRVLHTSTGGTSSLDGKMGKISIIEDNQDSMSLQKGQLLMNSAEDEELAEEVVNKYQKTNNPLRVSASPQITISSLNKTQHLQTKPVYSKREIPSPVLNMSSNLSTHITNAQNLYGRRGSRKEKILPKLESRENSHSIKKSTDREAIFKEKSQNPSRRKDSRELKTRGRSPKTGEPTLSTLGMTGVFGAPSKFSKQYNFNNILDNYHLKNKITDVRKKSSHLGSLVSSQNEISVLLRGATKKGSNKDLRKSKKKKNSKIDYDDLAQRKNSVSRRSKSRNISREYDQLPHQQGMRNHPYLPFDQLLFKKQRSRRHLEESTRQHQNQRR